MKTQKIKIQPSQQVWCARSVDNVARIQCGRCRLRGRVPETRPTKPNRIQAKQAGIQAGDEADMF
ncbi:MAG: hypothetical protein GY696_13655 [Gammaproteobacteria bacterium]|nr:hypothetical protein [Gammaproteobacteria bacterium]